MPTNLENVFYNNTSVRTDVGCTIEYNMNSMIDGIAASTTATDANYISEEAKAQIKGSKVLILNALRPQSHPTHFTLSEAIALTQSLDIPQTYFTHFSHQIGLHAIVEPSLPKGIGMSYDGMVITV